MKMKLLCPAVLALCLILVLRSEAATVECPCTNRKDCNHPAKNAGARKEVFVFSNGTTDLESWGWDTITTVIVPSSFSISNEKEAYTMCTAHSKGKKFGITVEANFSGQINESSEDAKNWVTSVITRQRNWHAEIITVNLLPYFTQDFDSRSQDHLALINILVSMKVDILEVTEIVKVACIIPWMPPCAENEASCDFASLSNDVCDYFIINPDSFGDLEDVKCRARANIPFSKLLYGISEYNSHHIPCNRIILGVPWHGYDYTCEDLSKSICRLPQVSKNSTNCDLSDRRRVMVGDILKNLTQFVDHNYDPLFNAPYFDYFDTVGKRHHQVWFEDQMSLISKYKLVVELQLKGLAVLYGDDLSRTSADLQKMDLMWSWISHEVLLSASEKPLSQGFYYADTVSGVAIGCLLLGAAFGIVLTCFGLRRRVKKPRPPFMRHSATDEFLDEDPNL